MAAADTGVKSAIPAGRERRRKGLRARLWRTLYGLMLWASQASLAQAAGEPVTAPAPLKVQVSIEAMDWSGDGTARLRLGYSTEDARLSPRFNRVSELLRLRQHNVVEQLRELRRGVGLDIELPDAGKLHLMLHPQEDKLGGGKRWAVSSVEASELQAAREGEAVWSLGTAVDLVETGMPGRDAQRERKLSVAPQLIVDADRLFGMRGDAVVTLQRAYWKSEQATAPEPVVQLRLNWRF